MHTASWKNPGKCSLGDKPSLAQALKAGVSAEPLTENKGHVSNHREIQMSDLALGNRYEFDS